MNTPGEEFEAWNQAHERLSRYLETFALGDHAAVSRLTLRLLDESRALHRTNPSAEPVTVAMRHAQAELNRWLAVNLNEEDQADSQVLASGYIALLLSRLSQTQPDAFLASPLPEPIRDSLQQTLLVTGPDLTVSSMTPRRFDYGPMLDLARQTWHRWDTKTFAAAILFWGGVYGICYWCISEYL
jgi:hypothetical protein